MRFIKWLFCILLGCIAFTAHSQTREQDFNQLGWYVYEGDHKLSSRWELHTEYQWRRVHFIKSWQQSLARLGTACQLLPQVKVAAGYTSFITHPYGNYPTADTGEPYPEHRFYQDLSLADTVRRAALEHRFRLEQRWLGQLASETGRQVTDWEYQNRIRYQIAVSLPLQGQFIDNQEWYVNFFDEVFIGFGKKVGQNIFNQNRVSGGLGYQFTDNFKIELNYLYQITQHAEPEPITDQTVFEYNQGFRFGINYDLDFAK